MREKPDFRRMLHDVPHTPGVYQMKDRLGRVIYVGKAKNLRRRLTNYFMPSRKTKADLKTRALINSIWDFEIHQVRNESEALLLEAKLIKEIRPRYNVTFRDDKRFLMVRIDLNEPLPKFRLTRLKKDDGARYFGPFAHSGALRETVTWLNLRYGLRSCRPRTPDVGDYQHCHADIIRNCSAPCIGRVTYDEYMERVKEALKVFEGRNRTILKVVKAEMEEAAATMDFEKAGKLRDVMLALEKVMQPARTFARGRGMANSEERAKAAMMDVVELQDELGLAQAPLVMECFDISNISMTYSVASMVRFTNGLPDNQAYRRYRIKSVEGQNDFASMAEVVQRRYARILRELDQADTACDTDVDSQEPVSERARRVAKRVADNGAKSLPAGLPDLIVVDGGKGQLAMAMKELQKIGLHDVPVVGLAKQREEVFFPDRELPVVIPHDRGALKLLQRLRDEAHRVANGYHQLMLSQRMRESVLDEIAGMSKARKAALLKKFGSVAEIRKAEPGAIAEIRGISLPFAAKILDFLTKGQL